MEYIMVNMDIILVVIMFSMVQIAYWRGQVRDIVYASCILIILVVILTSMGIVDTIREVNKYHSPSMACNSHVTTASIH